MKGIIYTFLFAVLAVVLVGCGNSASEYESVTIALEEYEQEADYKPIEQTGPLPEPTPEPVREPEPTLEPTPIPIPEPVPILAIGDTAEFGNWEVTLDSFRITDWIQTTGNRGFEADGGNQFIYAVVTVTNLDTEPRRFMPRILADVDSVIIYDDTFTFTRTRLLGYRDELEDMLTNPLTSSTGSIVFSVADRAAESDGSLILRIHTNREEILFSLR